MKELGSDKINYREIADSEANHSHIFVNIASAEILSMLREELTATEYSSAFAISASASIISAIAAISF